MTTESEWVVCSPLLSVDPVEPVVQVYICLGCGFYVLEPSDECPECKASMGSAVLPVDDLRHIEACDLIEKIAATHIKQATRAESERIPYPKGKGYL